MQPALKEGEHDYVWKSDELDSLEEKVDVVRVPKVETGLSVLDQVGIKDLALLHYVRRKVVCQLSQIDSATQALLQLGRWRQVFADARADPILGLLEVAQVLVGDVLVPLLVHLLAGLDPDALLSRKRHGEARRTAVSGTDEGYS